MPTRAQAKTTTDHDEIRQWAEQRGAKPASVRRTGSEGDIGILRLDFPGYSGGESLEPISWEDFFEKFDERGLALLHQETTARGQKSNFNKLVSRETAQGRPSRRRRVQAKTGGKKRGTKRQAASSRSATRKQVQKGRRRKLTAGAKAASKGRRRTGTKRGVQRSATRRTSTRGRASATRSRVGSRPRRSTARRANTRRTSSLRARSETRGRSGSQARGKVRSIANVSGSRAQVKATRGSNRGARTASARGQHRNEERRAA